MDRDRARPTARRIGRRSFLRGAAISALGLIGVAALGCDGGKEDGVGAGSEGSLLERARAQGFIRVGFANERPYGYADADGRVTGEAPEVARAVLAELGIPEIDGVVATFGSLIPGLRAGRFDLIAAGMFINPERCEQIVFSDPDYCIPQAFAVQAGNPLGLTSYEDVASSDAQLGVIAGGVEEGYALALGVPDARLTRFDDVAPLFEGLQAGQVDTVASTSLSIRAQLDRLGDANLEMTAGFTPVIDGVTQHGCGGYGFRAEDREFREAFNEVLVRMKNEGGIVAITEPFGFGPTEVDAAREVTAEALCR